MCRRHVSLRSLLCLIALLAVGMWSIAAQTSLAMSTIYTAYWLVPWLSLAAAIVARGSQRAVCIGSFVFGFGYWLVGFETLSAQPSTPPLRLVRRWLSWSPQSAGEPNHSQSDRLLTSELIDCLERNSRTPLPPGSKVMDLYNGGTY